MIILVTFGKDSIAQPLTRLGSRPLGWRPVTGVPYMGGGVAPSKGLREGAALSRSRSQVPAVAPRIWPHAVQSPGCLVVKASEVNPNMTQVLDLPLPNPVKKFVCQTPRPFRGHLFSLM